VTDATGMQCPSCGAENQERSRFCGACGAALDLESPTGVRKTVTIVFCDLVGSTALGERTDPEVLREVMARYHAELRAILERHGGTVEKFVGDAAMAIFGLPSAHEDDALRAVRAAVEMRDAVANLGLEVHVGVNTGEVVAGLGETLATGDAVNVAARLEQAAGAGDVLIGAATERLVREQIRSEAIEPLALKGKSEPVPAFRVREVLADVPAFTRPITAPFVGREDELGGLERAIRSTVETGTPHLATIVGPPGIGKSRLARELLGRADARVLVGRCLSYGEGITYLPLAEIVSQVGEVRAALGETVDGELVATRVDAAVGVAGTAATPEEIAWGFRKLCETLARERPLVVLFDDIHWAEPPLLDLIEYVSTFTQDVPLFVLCTARPDLFELRPTWSAPRPNASLLTLDPLSGSDTETLVTLLGQIAEATHARIVETAEGNPLFVEQLVAMQAETEGEELEVPPTLQALLTARIDRLTEAERAVVERGAVEGRLFHRGAVAELLPGSERRDVGGHLLTLVRKELIRPDRATLPGDDGFRFAHALIRDAAYDAIPKRQRAVLHERYADWLDSRLGTDAPDEILGYHLEQAYRYGADLGSPDAALGERGAERLAAAGHAARTRRDVGAATNLLDRAAGLIPVGARRAGLLVELGDALHVAGEMERAQAVLEEAVTLADSAGDTHAGWLARLGVAEIRFDREIGDAADAAQGTSEAAIEACEQLGDHAVLARAWGLIEEILSARFDAEAAQRAGERALQHARLAGDLILEVPLIIRSGGPIVYGSVPVTEGLRYAEEVLERLGDAPEIQAFALHLQAHLRARLGQFDGALEAVTAWRRHKRDLGQEGMYAQTAACAWDVCSWAEDWVRGEEVLLEAYELLERMGMQGYLSTYAAFLGEACLRQGRVDEAMRFSETSEELGASDDFENAVAWRRVRAKALAAQGELAAAETVARTAVEIAADAGFLDEAGLTWLDLAEILQAGGKEDVRTAGAEALALFERKGNLVGASWARRVLDASAGSA
jgi:class 3 adenylate cyclase/tetratricopeptide (TPR) repeat protein